MKSIRVALLQMTIAKIKEENLKKAYSLIKTASEKGADLVVLPEMFNCIYSAENFPVQAEEEGGATWSALSSWALEFGIYLVGGSIPERGIDGSFYNTSFVFNRRGEQIGKHRKIHLFDINITGGQKFRESDTLSPGEFITVFDTEFCVMGLAICYDLRFPEIFRLMADMGARIFILPAAFNMTTGPAHWELLFRSRALDNQGYALGAAPARDEGAKYVSYGNSIITSPWGEVVKRLDEKEGILIEDLDLEKIEKIRKELPALAHRRPDVYSLSYLKG